MRGQIQTSRMRPQADDQAEQQEVRPSGDWHKPVGLIGKLKSAASWAAGAAWIAPTLSGLTVLQSLVGADAVQKLNRIYVWGQLKATGCSVKYVVHPSVRDDKQYIFAQNHINILDHVAMHNATAHFKQGIELEKHFDYPFYGRFMKSRGTIGVPSKKEGRWQVVAERTRAELARGHSILVFPEGTRTRDGRVQEFRTGLFRLARDVGAEVVPVAVTGMYCFKRKGSSIMRPGKQITVYCDEPVSFAGLSDAELPAAIAKVRDQIASRVDAYFEETYGE